MKCFGLTSYFPFPFGFEMKLVLFLMDGHLFQFLPRKAILPSVAHDGSRATAQSTVGSKSYTFQFFTFTFQFDWRLKSKFKTGQIFLFSSVHVSRKFTVCYSCSHQRLPPVQRNNHLACVPESKSQQLFHGR